MPGPGRRSVAEAAQRAKARIAWTAPSASLDRTCRRRHHHHHHRHLSRNVEGSKAGAPPAVRVAGPPAGAAAAAGMAWGGPPLA